MRVHVDVHCGSRVDRLDPHGVRWRDYALANVVFCRPDTNDETAVRAECVFGPALHHARVVHCYPAERTVVSERLAEVRDTATSSTRPDAGRYRTTALSEGKGPAVATTTADLSVEVPTEPFPALRHLSQSRVRRCLECV